MSHFSTAMAAFGPLIQAGVANAQLPRLTRALEAGETLTFGPFTVSKAGIATKSKALVSWSQVPGCKLVQGFVVVNVAGKRTAWANPQARKVPNLPAFLSVVHRLLAR